MLERNSLPWKARVSWGASDSYADSGYSGGSSRQDSISPTLTGLPAVTLHGK